MVLSNQLSHCHGSPWVVEAQGGVYECPMGCSVTASSEHRGSIALDRDRVLTLLLSAGHCCHVSLDAMGTTFFKFENN